MIKKKKKEKEKEKVEIDPYIARPPSIHSCCPFEMTLHKSSQNFVCLTFLLKNLNLK
jgi:hypothetical protein